VSTPLSYFERMYAAEPDPWNFESRWYDNRKHALTVATLPRARYRSAFEPGCSLGVLTAELAQRCDALLASDLDPAAVAAARGALGGMAHVTVEHRAVPADWPAGTFDLVVVSELAYYLSEDDLAELVERATDALEPGGALLLCHWRHPVADYPSSGDAVHERFRSGPGLVPAVRHVEEDFVLDLLTAGPAPSPARREGLV